MRVDGDRGHAKGHVHDHVCGFAAYAWQSFESVAVAWDLGAVVFDQQFGERDDIFRLAPEEADRLDVFDQACFAEFYHLRGGLHALEELLRRPIDAFVGGLGREDHGHEQRVRVDVFEFALGLRVSFGQNFEDGGYFFGLGHGRSMTKGKGIAKQRWKDCPRFATVADGLQRRTAHSLRPDWLQSLRSASAARAATASFTS